MKRIRKSKIKKDASLIKFFNSKAIYVLIFLALLVYLFQDAKILNRPFYLVFILYLIALGIVILIFIFRYRKYRQYYTQEIREFLFLDKIILITGVVLLVIVIESILSIPVDFAIKKYSKAESIAYYDCKITNVITTGVDKIHFIFLDRRYSRYFNVNGFSRRELIDNYYIELEVRQSIFNTYYIESMSLKKIERLP